MFSITFSPLAFTFYFLHLRFVTLTVFIVNFLAFLLSTFKHFCCMISSYLCLCYLLTCSFATFLPLPLLPSSFAFVTFLPLPLLPSSLRFCYFLTFAFVTFFPFPLLFSYLSLCYIFLPLPLLPCFLCPCYICFCYLHACPWLVFL